MGRAGHVPASIAGKDISVSECCVARVVERVVSPGGGSGHICTGIAEDKIERINPAHSETIIAAGRMTGHVAAGVTIEIVVVLGSARSEAVIAAPGMPEQASASVAIEHKTPIRSDVTNECVITADRAIDQVSTRISIHDNCLMSASSDAEVVVTTLGLTRQCFASVAIGIHPHSGRKGQGNSTLNMSLPAMAQSEMLPPASPYISRLKVSPGMIAGADT